MSPAKVHPLRTQKRPPTIHDFMSPRPSVIHPRTTIEEVYSLMRDNGFRHLPVEEDGRLVGVVSERDILVALATDRKRIPTAKEVMTPQPYAVGPDEELEAVLEVMAGNKLGCTVVKDQGERVIGIFTTHDALRAMATLLRERG